MASHHIKCSADGSHTWGKVTRGGSHDGQWSRASCIKCGEVFVENRCNIKEESTSGDAVRCAEGGEHFTDLEESEMFPPTNEGVEVFGCNKCDARITRTTTMLHVGAKMESDTKKVTRTMKCPDCGVMMMDDYLLTRVSPAS